MTGDFKLSLPVTWVELGLDPVTRAQTIADIVAERGAAGQQLGLSPEQLADLLENLAAQAEAQNGLYVAFFSDVMEGAPVSASLVLSILAGSGGVPPPEPARRSGSAGGSKRRSLMREPLSSRTFNTLSCSPTSYVWQCSTSPHRRSVWPMRS